MCDLGMPCGQTGCAVWSAGQQARERRESTMGTAARTKFWITGSCGHVFPSERPLSTMEVPGPCPHCRHPEARTSPHGASLSRLGDRVTRIENKLNRLRALAEDADAARRGLGDVCADTVINALLDALSDEA